jgi:hypothetical protein
MIPAARQKLPPKPKPVVGTRPKAKPFMKSNATKKRK